MPSPRQSVPDFSHLSDAELSEMLKSYGVDVGPINAATRKTYERKLAKLQTEEPASQSQVVDDVDESIGEDVNASSVQQELSTSTADVATSPYHQSEDEHENTNRVVAREKYKERSMANTIVTTTSRHQPENDKEVVSREKHEERSVKPTILTTPVQRWPENYKEEIQVRHSEPASRPVPVLSKIPQPVMSKVREQDFTSRIESRPSLPLTRRTPVPRATPVTSYSTPVTSYSTPIRPSISKLPQGKKREYPVWLPVLIVGIAVILGYLIYANMEPAAKSNIPGVSNKLEV